MKEVTLNSTLLDYRLTRLGIPAMLAVLVLFVSSQWIHLESQRLQQEERSLVQSKATALRARLEGELNSTVSLANGLVGYIAVEDAITEKRATRVLSTLYSFGRHIRVLSVAPNNIISYVYPREGNEAALGRDYRQLPGQWASVEKAIKTRKSVLAGPVNLVQGGVGLINRTPVFDDKDVYWGVLSTVLNFQELFASAGVLEQTDGVNYAMRGKDGLGEKGEVFFGSKALFDTSPLLLDIEIPGGRWQIAASPSGGWRQPGKGFMLFRLLGAVVALAAGGITWLFFNERWKARLSALRDPLTELPNRRLAVYRIEVEIARSQRLKKGFAILFVDLDGFKPVNDKYGHKAGDIALQVISRQMNETVRKSDLVARLGGDEFLIILCDADSEELARAVANKVQQAVRLPIDLGDGVVAHLDASIGVSMYPENGSTVDELIARADDAMYDAKRAGKGAIRFARNATPIANERRIAIAPEAAD